MSSQIDVGDEEGWWEFPLDGRFGEAEDRDIQRVLCKTPGVAGTRLEEPDRAPSRLFFEPSSTVDMHMTFPELLGKVSEGLQELGV